MKTLALVSAAIGIMSLFSMGYLVSNPQLSSTTPPSDSKIEQVHLSCWDEQGETDFQRIRLVLNNSLHGLAWLTNFDGLEAGEGTIAPDSGNPSNSGNFKTTQNESNLEVDIQTSTHNIKASIPSFVFQPHIRSIKVQISEDDKTANLECRKINLQKKQVARAI